MMPRRWVVVGILLGWAMPVSAQWNPIGCAPADLPPEAMFDVVQAADGFEAESLNWEAAIGQQNARTVLVRDTISFHSEPAALRVDYEFLGEKELEYVQLGMSLALPEPGQAFGFWVNHDGSPLTLRLRIADKSGEVHQMDMISRKRAGWQFVACTLDAESGSWGGDGNRQRDYPCHLEGIVIDRPQQGYVGKGSLWIDDVALLRTREVPSTLKVAAQQPALGNLYAVGDSVALRAVGEGDLIRWQWCDYWGHVLTQNESSAAGAVTEFRLPEPGYYVCRIELLQIGRVTEVLQYSCAAIPGGRVQERSDFVGVCSHYGHNSYPLPSMDLLCRYGVDQFRDEISWGSYERRRGHYEMPQHAAEYLQHAARLKMRPLIIYDYSNQLYDKGGFPNSDEAIAGFAAYAVDLTRQTQGQVAMFEVWNEWIGGCGMNDRPGDHGPEAYGRLLKATYAAVKQARPDVTVVGIGGEYGTHCAENVAKALTVAGPDSQDGWSIHPYRYPRLAEQSDLAGEVERIVRRVRETGVTQKAWITEIGWPTHRTSGGSDETTQAQQCVRTLALLQSTGLVEKVFWYDFKDDGTRRDYNEHNFGLVRHQSYNCAPKPGMVAISTFVRMTGATQYEKITQTGSVYAVQYRRSDGRDVVVAWTSDKPQPIQLTGQLEEAYNIMGAAVSAKGIDRLTEDPIYLIGRDLSIARS